MGKHGFRRNKIRSLKAGNLDISIIQKGSLLYIIMEREDLGHIENKRKVLGTDGRDTNPKKKPSLTLLQRVVEWLHCQFICLATNSSLKHLEENPSYDVINDIYRDLKLFEGAYKQAIINPGIFLDAWMSTRMDAEIRLKTESIVSQCKPEEIYCGLLLARNSVVNLICPGNTKIKEPSEDRI